MRILLDESLPRPLAELLTGHETRSARQMGWTSLSNGALLRQAAERFDALLTADQNIEFQQNLRDLPIAVVVLIAPSNRLESLEPLVPQLLKILQTLQPKKLIRVGAEPFRFSGGAQRRPLQPVVGRQLVATSKVLLNAMHYTLPLCELIEITQ